MSAFDDFIEGISNYGIPSRVRADNGSEFVHVNAFMVFANGENRGSFLTGRSVHNQRIERLWRDVFCKVLQKYYNLFHHMENHKILDIDNPVQISCLHHVFASRIGKDLSDWRNAHNNHKIRTEGNKTPRQLWYAASTLNSDRDLTAMNNIYRQDPNDVTELISEFRENNRLIEPDDIKIVLPRNPLPLTLAEAKHLKDTIDVLSVSESHGIDIYASVLQYVNSCVN